MVRKVQQDLYLQLKIAYNKKSSAQSEYCILQIRVFSEPKCKDGSCSLDAVAFLQSTCDQTRSILQKDRKQQYHKCHSSTIIIDNPNLLLGAA